MIGSKSDLLGNKFNKKVQDLYIENYKTVFRKLQKT